MGSFRPTYLQLLQQGLLTQRVAQAFKRLDSCNLCPRGCQVNRRDGEMGVCRTGEMALVSSYHPHFGEEKPLSGWRGSGTIFFTRCNLQCQFCQNNEISQTDDGQAVDPQDLAVIMLELQYLGCHNINFVSPTHIVPQILAAVALAAKAGLHIPLVYNTGGYDCIETLKLLEGVIDIYMPDMKYASAANGLRFSNAPDYPKYNQVAVREMHRQVGELALDQDGIATRGLLVRHLVLPNDLAGTAEIVHFLATEISPETYLNLMDQYRPAYRASRYTELNRQITPQEFQHVARQAFQAGLHRLD